MSKSYRIRTTPGEDNGYLKVNVDLNQDYDHLEILSLKISQIDEYQDYCSDYGVIAGRVDINNGFGVPNVKVSIFVPVEDVDLSDPVISKLYPYEDPFPDKKNINGIRYNILPKNKQSLDHTPVGTFPKKREILDDATTLEIYEKYYKYTTTTNKSGDYILFGVPLGQHYLHYDCDISDIGFISSRPYEMISEGYSEELFDTRFKFKSGNNLDSLPQIFSQNIPITVEPFWCDSLSVGSALGINRLDFSIGYEVTPTAIFMGSIFSDDEKDSLNKNCKPGRQMGKMNEVITGSGKIEAIRRNTGGGIETFNFKDNSIDENGNWSLLVPMNIRKVVTDEFGNLVPSPDGVAGIATEGDYRFRISMDTSDTDKRLRQRAKFLVPNTNNNFNFGEYSQEELKTSSDFTLNTQLSTVTSGSTHECDLSNQYNYIEEFYPFRWKKVYTVKQYIGRMQKANGNDEARGFIGIKDIINSEGVNKFPSNRFDTSINPIYVIICLLLTFVGVIIGFINGISMMINGLLTEICQVKLPTKLKLVYCFKLGFTFCNDNYRDICCFGNSGSALAGANCTGNARQRCNSCECTENTSNSTSLGDQQGVFQIQLGWQCLFGKLFCQNCGKICGPDNDTHECCRNQSNCNSVEYQSVSLDAPSGTNCCYTCCIKIPLIPLRCDDEGKIDPVALIASPFGPTDCNRRFAKPFGCQNCGGYQTQVIKDWVGCLLEPVAVFLKMLKFDFYNDWVGGSLYFPLIKRKYKLKKSKRKFGQIKKDKFCDFECRDDKSSSINIDFQGLPYYSQWRIKIPDIIGPNPSIMVAGCTAKVKGKRVSSWFGTVDNDDQGDNLDLAAKGLTFRGTNANSDGCVIKFGSWVDFQNTFNSEGIYYEYQSKETSTEHGKPEYIETVGPDGNSTWTNIGGHGHHKNTCDDTSMVERKEFFKLTLDCLDSNDLDIPGSPLLDLVEPNYAKLPCNGGPSPGGDWQYCLDNQTTSFLNNQAVLENNVAQIGFCIQGCEPDCGSNGVAPCNNKQATEESIGNYNGKTIRHGLITELDGQIYYTPRMLWGDSKFNPDEYKGNLLLPTTIMELGSSVYCDIDDVPFIMDQLEPTTFAASFEDMKYKFNEGTPYTDGLDGVQGTADDEPGGILKEIIEYDDKKDSSLNLRAYVEFSCNSVVCVNTSAAVNQSQIGVEIIDKNDLGIEIGNCFVRFEHDTDIREYFCKRFNGYQRGYNTGNNLSFHHTRPGSIEFDNEYGVYPDITLTDGYPLYYQTIEGDLVKSEYNDGDSFTPGDGCGYKSMDNDNPWGLTDYFYGLAPGQTSGFLNYPNYDTVENAYGTINFGSSQGIDGVDEIFSASTSGVISDDDNNGDVTVKGIRHNRSQTPYFLYFGLVPQKTALNKVVGKFFADKINAVTLQGVGGSNDDVSQNIVNKPNVNNEEDNPFTVFKTCLGDTLIDNVQVGTDTTVCVPNNFGGSGGNENPGSPDGPGNTTPPPVTAEGCVELYSSAGIITGYTNTLYNNDPNIVTTTRTSVTNTILNLTASICDDTTELDGGSHVGIGGQVIQFQAYGGDPGDVGRIEYRFWVSQPDNNGGDNYLEIVAFGPSSDGLGRYPLATGQYMCYNTNDPSPGGAPTLPSGCSSSGSIGTTNICCSGIGYGTYGHSKQYPAFGYDNEIITSGGVTLPVGMNGGGPIEIGVYDVYIDIVHIGGNTTGWVEATLIP
jgi:hypothetical protein